MINLAAFNRILIITGHYGSGKTEFAVSLAAELASDNLPPPALIDLDIVNPYFRSRERRAELEALGINVYGSLYDKEITAELPALGAALRAPLENKSTRVIVDAGGNDSGALPLNQFRKYFTPEDSTLAAVVNFKRYETRTPREAAEHVRSIETVTGLTAAYLVNNTHLLRETTPQIIKAGHELALETCKLLGKGLLCTTYPKGVVEYADIADLDGCLFPVGLHMRPTWLDA